MQVLAHNMLSQFTSRELKTTTNKKTKSTEKLASGYRINRSADDAAGLEISEKLRWQIRGLNKGKNNIQEGISLIKTGEGALSEVHDILQRVRELSLQAYNDTNTEEDRIAIQNEVDDILEEIDRIADSTMFNTKPLLRGNPPETIKITKDMEVEYTVHDESYISLPPWVNVDPNMEPHAAYNQAPGSKDSYMLQTQPDGTIWYYGPKDPPAPGATWYGDTPAGIAAGYTGWDNSISNNASAKVDFSGLKNASTAQQLYENVFLLIGCQIRFPCGTCSSQHQGITFSGSESGLGVDDNAVISDSYGLRYKYQHGNLNLSTTLFTDPQGNTQNGYFSSIKDLLNRHKNNTALTDAQKTAETQALADAIAKDLRNKVFEAMDNSSFNEHFDRVVKAANDPYSVIVYDYRDNVSLTDPTAANSKVITEGRVNIDILTSRIQPGETVDIQKPLHIMAGAVRDSWLPINLPDTSLQKLGLAGYSVAKYSETEIYSESYQAKINDWLINGYKDTVHTKTVTGKHMKFDHMNWVNGEGYPVYKTEPYTATVTVVDRVWQPKPAAQPGDITLLRDYEPSPLWIVDYAIAQVSAARSSFGAEQNRLEHAYSINATSSENSQSAESRIRDADMAEEMVENTKHSILEQAGQSMLAQANQSIQGILSLLS